MYVIASTGSTRFADTLERAEEIYEEECRGCEFVELMKGTSGHYETIRQSW